MQRWFLLLILLFGIFISVGCSDNNLNNAGSVDAGKENPEKNTHQSEIKLYEQITGVYNGSIDNNFIEIDVDDDITFKQMTNIPSDPFSFKVSQSVQNKLQSLTEKDNIMFDCYKEQDGVWIILDIKNLGKGQLVKTAKGIYIGRIDQNFIEIKIRDDYKTFKFAQEEERINGFGGLTDYSAVYLEYVRNNKGQLEISSISNALKPGIGNAPSIKASGIFVKFINDSLCEFKISGESKMFWIAEEIKKSAQEELEQNNSVDFAYYKDDYGRDVIIGFGEITKEIKTDTGSFIEINDNKIRIKISGTPNEISAKEFSLTKEARANFAKLNLKKYDGVRFTYFNSDGGLNVISEINVLK